MERGGCDVLGVAFDGDAGRSKRTRTSPPETLPGLVESVLMRKAWTDSGANFSATTPVRLRPGRFSTSHGVLDVHATGGGGQFAGRGHFHALFVADGRKEPTPL